jgi:class 3 adenylate cyclase
MHALTTYPTLNSEPHSLFAGVVGANALALHGGMLVRSQRTLLFTDIVESTQMLERLGDEGWYTLLMRHDAIVRGWLGVFGGHEVKCAGDGFFAVFDVPARGIHCAAAIRSALEVLGMRIRCGVHAGECLTAGSQVSGLAVHITARIASAARPNEILVSRAVKELATGADVAFAEGRLHALRGVSGEHELFAVKSAGQGAPGPLHPEETGRDGPDCRASRDSTRERRPGGGALRRPDRTGRRARREAATA